MTEDSTAPDGARETLERLYDDPDARLDALDETDPGADSVTGQVAVLKALAHEDRLRVLRALSEGECCVCELQALLDAPQSTVATHLRKLRDAGVVRSRKQGRWSYYRIADTAVLDVLDLVAAIEEGT